MRESINNDQTFLCWYARRSSTKEALTDVHSTSEPVQNLLHQIGEMGSDVEFTLEGYHELGYGFST